MITGFNHTSFTVSDIDRAIAFWTGPLGFELDSRGPRSGSWQEAVTGVTGAELTVAHLYGYGTHVEFIKYSDGDGSRERIEPNQVCAAHVCLEVDDIEATWDALLAAGASPQGRISPVANGPMSGLKAAYLRDPDGVIIELVELGQKPSAR